MMMQNYLSIDGRLSREPVVNTSKHGLTYCAFGICYNQRKKVLDMDGTIKRWDNVPHWFNCVAFGPLAEYVGEMKKGELVNVVGKIEYQQYDRDGKTISHVTIICEEVKEIMYRKKVKPEDKKDDISQKNVLPFKKASELKTKVQPKDKAAVVF